MIFAHYGHLIDEHASAFRRLEGFSPFTAGFGTPASGGEGERVPIRPVPARKAANRTT
jgi:hypothetical protein